MLLGCGLKYLIIRYLGCVLAASLGSMPSCPAHACADAFSDQVPQGAAGQAAS